MKIKSLIALVMLAMLSLGSVESVIAQTRAKVTKEVSKDRKKKNLKMSPEELKEYRRKMYLRQQDSITFYNAKLAPGQYFLKRVENDVIAKGDSTRIKYLLDPKQILRFEVEGYGEASPEDIKNGVWILTVKPEKTTAIVERKTLVIGHDEKIFSEKGCAFIIVTDADKVEDIRAKIKSFSDSMDYKGREMYKKQLIGEELVKQAIESINEYNAKAREGVFEFVQKADGTFEKAK